MADATTANYKFTKPEVGASADTWGAKLNTDFDSLDKLLGAVATTGSANAYVLTSGQTLTAYATGQSFRIIPNFTNSGACTLNVDAIGAKNIYKNVNGTPTACVSGDIPSGIPITVTYDGTQFIAHGIGLDPTLTALAALSWSSGNALVQFTAADTVSLTLTPSVSSVTASRAGQPASFTNSTDNATNVIVSLASSRATPAAFDQSILDFYLNNSTPAQKLFARLAATISTVTASSEDGRLDVGLVKAGSYAALYQFATTAFRPTTNDGVALGSSTQSFSDLFLASGGVINWNNGNVTITHAAGQLAVVGGVKNDVSSDTGGTLTTASKNRVVTLATAPTIDGNVFAANDWIELYNDTSSSMTITQGSTGSPTQRLSGTATTGNLTLPQRGTAFVRFKSATEWRVMGDAF